MDAARNLAAQIGNIAGIATATGGSSLWANGYLHFLEDNAKAIGVLCTVGTFFVFTLFKTLEYLLLRKQKRDEE